MRVHAYFGDLQSALRVAVFLALLSGLVGCMSSAPASEELPTSTRRPPREPVFERSA